MMPPAFPREPGKEITKSPTLEARSSWVEGAQSGHFVAVDGYVRALEFWTKSGTFVGRLEDLGLVTRLYQAWAKHGGAVVLLERDHAAPAWVVELPDGRGYALAEAVFDSLEAVPREALVPLPDESTVTLPAPAPQPE